jgi:hypothetical protein
MRLLTVLAVLVLAGCGGGVGGPNNHDPARYGVVRVAFSSDDPTFLPRASAMAAVVDELDKLGPDFQAVTSGEYDVRVAIAPDSEIPSPLAFDCTVGFDRATRTIRVSSRCPGSDEDSRTLAAHSLGHWLGMAHVATAGVAHGTVGMDYAVGPPESEEWINAREGDTLFFVGYDATAVVSQADVDEFIRTHPTR